MDKRETLKKSHRIEANQPVHEKTCARISKKSILFCFFLP